MQGLHGGILCLWSADGGDEAGREKESAPATKVAAMSVDWISTIPSSLVET
jgi:hypothetical protein